MIRDTRAFTRRRAFHVRDEAFQFYIKQATERIGFCRCCPALSPPQTVLWCWKSESARTTHSWIYQQARLALFEISERIRSGMAE